jgi:hypothetical protein
MPSILIRTYKESSVVGDLYQLTYFHNSTFGGRGRHRFANEYIIECDTTDIGLLKGAVNVIVHAERQLMTNVNWTYVACWQLEIGEKVTLETPVMFWFCPQMQGRFLDQIQFYYVEKQTEGEVVGKDRVRMDNEGYYPLWGGFTSYIGELTSAGTYDYGAEFLALNVVWNRAMGRARKQSYLHSVGKNDVYRGKNGSLAIRLNSLLMIQRVPAFKRVIRRIYPLLSDNYLDGEGRLQPGMRLLAPCIINHVSDFQVQGRKAIQPREDVDQFFLLWRQQTRVLLQSYLTLAEYSNFYDCNTFYSLPPIHQIWRFFEDLQRVQYLLIKVFSTEFQDYREFIGNLAQPSAPNGYPTLNANHEELSQVIYAIQSFLAYFSSKLNPKMQPLKSVWKTRTDRKPLPSIIGDHPKVAGFDSDARKWVSEIGPFFPEVVSDYHEMLNNALNAMGLIPYFDRQVKPESFLGPQRLTGYKQRNQVNYLEDGRTFAEFLEKGANTRIRGYEGVFGSRMPRDRATDSTAIDIFKSGPEIPNTPARYREWIFQPLDFDRRPVKDFDRLAELAAIDEEQRAEFHAAFLASIPRRKKTFVWDNTIHPLTAEEEDEEVVAMLERSEEGGKATAKAAYDIAAAFLFFRTKNKILIYYKPVAHTFINATIGQINPNDEEVVSAGNSVNLTVSTGNVSILDQDIGNLYAVPEAPTG